MTRDPLHYWRRRRGMSLGAYVHNARLRRLYRFNPTDRLYAGSKLFAMLGRRTGMSYGVAAEFVGHIGKAYP
ncbi:MAG TPA: hypothetical protein VFX15_08715 [Actinomycetes bacterium]|nr:hypothetical protein [Actinomycetes bacterium]